MDYAQTVNYLYNAAPLFSNIGAGAYKEGLSTTLALDEHFGHPHRRFRTIHVAGTNGKGSVSSTLAAILQSCGLKVGLYTSPHLIDFRERARVNGVMMPEQRVIDFVEHERAFFEPLHPSFFELTTVLAFLYFAEQEVDVAVVEVGLGGRLDCTNIITPDLSVITNISYDHQQFLGNTLRRIAAEKAGIMKAGVPVVVGETNGHRSVHKVFVNKAHEMGSPLRFADEETFPPVRSELKGFYQRANMATVQCALSELRRQPFYKQCLTPARIRYGFAHVSELTGLQGRWQTLGTAPRLVCDAGHNAAGIRYVVQQLKAQRCRALRVVFGMVDDKDYTTAIDLLSRLRKAHFYFTQPSTKRALSAQVLADYAAAKGMDVRMTGSLDATLTTALADASPDDFIFVGGSCYVVADLLTLRSEAKH